MAEVKKVSGLTSWTQKAPVGGRIDNTPLSFTNDSKYIFSACGPAIKLYSATSGSLVRVLRGHTRTITGLVENPDNFLQLYSCSHDGTVRLWNFHEAKLLQTFEVDTNALISGIVANKETKTLYISVRDKKNITSIGELNQTHFTPLFNGHFSSFSLSPSGKYIVAQGQKGCTLYNLSTKKQFHLEIPKGLATCIAVHPAEEMLAIGSALGVVAMFQIMDKNDTLTFSKLSHERWHHGPVGDLVWDPTGVKLISGGCEAVLVFWNYSSGLRDYIPRLGVADIKKINVSPDQNLYALQCSDNSIKVYNMYSKRLSVSIKGVAYKHVSGSTGFNISPNHNALAFAGPSGTLQFFDPRTDTTLGTIQVGLLDRHAWKTGETEKVGSIVCGCEFSSNGRWLVTVDRRELYKQIHKIQFWQIQNRTYVLNTQTEMPHKGNVTATAYHPHLDMCVTCDDEGTFKIWESYEFLEDFTVEVKPKIEKKQDEVVIDHAPIEELNEETKGKEEQQREEGKEKGERIRRKKELWRFRSEGSYRDVPVTSAAFSSDGSTLALAYQQIITLWDPLDNSLISSLTYPSPDEPITNLRFISSAAPNHLVVHSKETIWVWDLLSFSVLWELKTACTRLATDPLSDHFAVSCVDKASVYILLFSSPSPRPLCFWKLPFGINVVDLVFYPPSNPTQTYSDLAYITQADEIFILGPRDTRIDDFDVVTNKNVLEGNLVFKQRKLDTEVAQTITTNEVYKESLALEPITQSILSGPSHALPAPSIFFDEFMKNLVVSRPKDGEKNGAAKTDQVEAMEESEDGEQEEEAKEAETGKVAETQLNVVEIVSSIQDRPTETTLLSNSSYDALVSFFRTLEVSPVSHQTQPTSTPKKLTEQKRKRATPNTTQAQTPTKAKETPTITSSTPKTTPKTAPKTTPQSKTTPQPKTTPRTTPKTKKARQQGTQSTQSSPNTTQTSGQLKRKRSGSQLITK